MGVNFKENWIKPRDEWQRLFVKSSPGFNVYLGWRFHPYFGAEFGYEWTADKPLSTRVPNGASLLGVLNNTGATSILSSKIRFKSGAADLNIFIPLIDLSPCKDLMPEAILSLGVAGMKPSLRIRSADIAPATTFSSQFTGIQGRSKAVFRLGLGLQSLVIEQVGVRALWRWENTSVLRTRNSLIAHNAATRKIFKDGQSLALGVFFKF